MKQIQIPSRVMYNFKISPALKILKYIFASNMFYKKYCRWIRWRVISFESKNGHMSDCNCALSLWAVAFYQKIPLLEVNLIIDKHWMCALCNGTIGHILKIVSASQSKFTQYTRLMNYVSIWQLIAGLLTFYAMSNDEMIEQYWVWTVDSGHYILIMSGNSLTYDFAVSLPRAAPATRHMESRTRILWFCIFKIDDRTCRFTSVTFCLALRHFLITDFFFSTSIRSIFQSSISIVCVQIDSNVCTRSWYNTHSQ